ncbi:MAG: hypothetical protein HKO59_14050 [Phycisphaerales bacterium]|nr:hypothetical protein [Phycisphaerales bacterium]NNM27083.1 hypothetical protein [Phycisphaerales bacterium]
MKTTPIIAAAVVAGLSSAATAGLTWHQPGATAYTAASDGPWNATAADFSYFYLENFEQGAVVVPGLDLDGGAIRAPGAFTDSVDEDDGAVDGFGTFGRSFWNIGDGVTSVLRFDADELGALPTHAGLVWTDGNRAADVTFEAFDAAGVSLGSFIAQLGDDFGNGTTGEDRFLGVEFTGGVSRIEITTSLGGLEFDHVQFGLIPAPPAFALLAGLALARRRRR